ncbi:MAG: exonuclease domain-containing protein [Oscillospiraceae bacterium]
MQFIVLDLEWNMPFNAENRIKTPVHLRGEIIEIGAVKLDENFNISDKFKVMIKPKYYKKIHSAVSKLTKIKSSDLKACGVPFEDAFRQFKEWCGEDYRFITWGNDDIGILEDNLAIYGIDRSFIPECYDLQLIFDNQITKENRQHSLSNAVSLLGEPEFEAHDALNDAIGTALVCSHLDMKSAIENYKSLIKLKIHNKKGSDHCIKKNYSSIRKLLNSKEVCTFSCPECNKTVKCGEWAYQARDRKISIAECVCKKRYFIRVNFRKNEDNTFRASRMVYNLDENKLSFYNKMLTRTAKIKAKRNKS